MTPQDLSAVYYKAMHSFDWKSTSGNQPKQKMQHDQAWSAVLAHARKWCEVENERLREENRDLRQTIAGMVQAQAQMPAEVMKALAERAT